MEFSVAGPIVSIKDAAFGQCFAFRRLAMTYLAMKLTNGESVAVLWAY
jgi:hypothetical protein